MHELTLCIVVCRSTRVPNLTTRYVPHQWFGYSLSWIYLHAILQMICSILLLVRNSSGVAMGRVILFM